MCIVVVCSIISYCGFAYCAVLFVFIVLCCVVAKCVFCPLARKNSLSQLTAVYS